MTFTLKTIINIPADGTRLAWTGTIEELFDDPDDSFANARGDLLAVLRERAGIELDEDADATDWPTDYLSHLTIDDIRRYANNPRAHRVVAQSTWSGAELRSRLTFLGLTLNQFATLQEWDARTLRREASGAAPVSARTEEAVRGLESQAADALEAMNDATDDNLPIRIPFWSQDDARLALPGSWWHAVAGRLIAIRGTDAEIVYDRLDDDE